MSEQDADPYAHCAAMVNNLHEERNRSRLALEEIRAELERVFRREWLEARDPQAGDVAVWLWRKAQEGLRPVGGP